MGPTKFLFGILGLLIVAALLFTSFPNKAEPSGKHKTELIAKVYDADHATVTPDQVLHAESAEATEAITISKPSTSVTVLTPRPENDVSRRKPERNVAHSPPLK